MHNRVYKRNKCTETQTLQKIEIVQFIAIAHDIALDLTGIDPRHVILHIARHEIGRISNNLRTDTNMTLFDEGGSLVCVSTSVRQYCQHRYEKRKERRKMKERNEQP